MADDRALEAVQTSFERWFDRDAARGTRRLLAENQSRLPEP